MQKQEHNTTPQYLNSNWYKYFFNNHNFYYNKKNQNKRHVQSPEMIPVMNINKFFNSVYLLK